MSAEDAGAMVGVILAIVIWGSMVVGGIRIAKRKNRSPHWMWFGLHPLGALIVLIVMAALKPLVVCPHCSRKLPEGAMICPFCTHSISGVTPGSPTPAMPSPTADSPGYDSVGGWLLFLCVALTIISPLVNGGRLISGLAQWDNYSAYETVANLVVVEAILGFSIIAFSIFAGISLWTRNPRAVVITKRFFMAVLAYQAVMTVLVFSANLPWFARDEIQQAVLTQAIGSVIGVSIWWTYLNKSKRVADLFPSEQVELPSLSRLIVPEQHAAQLPQRSVAQTRMTPADEVPAVVRGSYNEPYCSRACMEEATLFAHGEDGPARCELCHTSVIRQGQGPAFPFRGRTLYLCTRCAESGHRLIEKLDECCHCGKHVMTDAGRVDRPAPVGTHS